MDAQYDVADWMSYPTFLATSSNAALVNDINAEGRFELPFPKYAIVGSSGLKNTTLAHFEPCEVYRGASLPHGTVISFRISSPTIFVVSRFNS